MIKSMFRRAARRLANLPGLDGTPSIGSVRFGDFGTTRPIDPNFGYGRGLPVDRYYIENFLELHAADIRGHALEIGDAEYCTKYGSAITRQEILHVAPRNPQATIVGDISMEAVLSACSLDCIVLTQTLQLIYDLHGAVANIHRALRPGGVALVTVPGITPIDRGEWRDTWFWSFTLCSARRLFGQRFGPENVSIETHGNVYAATALLHGLALEELDRAKLNVVDEAYPVIVTVRATRSR